jgi:hypothetical protein
MSYLIKNQENQKHEDRYKTENLTITQKVNKYTDLLNELKEVKNKHKVDINTIKELKKNSESVSKFKLDEMQKKMRNEMFRLSEECRKHNDSQKGEVVKIKNQINIIENTCTNINKALKELLERVIILEANLGPNK